MHTHAQTCRDVHTHATHAELLTAHSAFLPTPSLTFLPHPTTPPPPPATLAYVWGHSGVMLICILYMLYIRSYTHTHTHIYGLNNMNTRIAITMINRLRPIGKCSGLMTKDSNWRQAPTPPSPSLPLWNHPLKQRSVRVTVRWEGPKPIEGSVMD